MEGNARRIALWGYGRFGKRLLEVMRKNWSSRFVVTEVFDKSIGNDGGTVLEGDTPLLDPDMILAEYRAGRFDAVLISVADPDVHAQIASEAESLGIPTVTLVAPDDFRPWDEFENAVAHECPYGFIVHEYSNVYGFYHPLCERVTQPYLFDENGRGLRNLWHLEFTNAEPSIWNPARPLDLQGADVISMSGEYYLGVGMYFKNLWHFTYQTVDKIMSMEKAGFKGRYLLVRAGFTVPLLSLLGLDLQRVVWLDELDPDAIYLFEKVFAAELPDIFSVKLSVEALLDLGRIIGENAGDDDREYPSRLYVKRIGIRKMLGSDDVLEHYGFTTMVPEDYTLAEQIRFFKHADIVVSPHGAALTNTLFMKPGSVVVETFSNSWIAPLFVEVLRAKGVRYFPVVQSSDLTRTVALENTVDFSVDNTVLSMVIESAIELVGQELPA